MLLTEENSIHLSSTDFVDYFSVELFSEENLYLLKQERMPEIPNYFYITAYILEFHTALEMSGLATLLSNSSTYNFENTLNSLKEIGSQNLSECLEAILETLKKFGLTPVAMRERFVNGTKYLPEYSIVKMGQYHDSDLAMELEAHQDYLYSTGEQIRDDLGLYLQSVRGK